MAAEKNPPGDISDDQVFVAYPLGQVGTVSKFRKAGHAGKKAQTSASSISLTVSQLS